MKSMSDNKVVKAYILDAEKSKLEEEFETSSGYIQKKESTNAEIIALEEQLSVLIKAMSDDELNAKIAKVRAEKAEIVEILNNLDIEDRVQSFENQLKTLLDSLSKLRKKKHSLEYKKQLLQKNLVGALSNIEPSELKQETSEN